MSFAEHWPRSDKSSGDDYKPAAGNYAVEVIDTQAFVTADGRELGKIELEITDGLDRGKRFLHWLSFKTDNTGHRAREALQMYGVDVARIQSFDDLDDAMHPILGVRADVSVDARGFTHVNRAQTLLSDVPAPEPTATPAAARTPFDDDEIPF